MIDGYWMPCKDGDARAFALMRNHYSCQAYTDGRRQDLGNRNRHLFVGPGEKMVLLGSDCRALFVWRKFIDKSGQQGVNCAVFHNESDHLSSELILEAEQLAHQRWPQERLYTYVNPRKIRTGKPKSGIPFPGKCFVKAGWSECGETTKGLLVLEKYQHVIIIYPFEEETA